MPLYTIEHSIPLDKPQRDALAQTITHIHTRKFTTPSLFVNVQFVDSTGQCNYIAGKEVRILFPPAKLPSLLPIPNPIPSILYTPRKPPSTNNPSAL